MPVTRGVASPKFQLQVVGTPVVVSVKLTANGAAPLVALARKEATGIAGTPGATVTTLVVVAVPARLVTIRVTVKVPGVVNTWVGAPTVA
jgi:hypothetical protein